MIVIHVQVQISADQAPKFVEAAQRDTLKGAAFAGCRSYRWSQDLNTPHSYILTEEWETRADFDAFKASEYFRDMGAILMPMLAGAPGSAYYDATPFEA